MNTSCSPRKKKTWLVIPSRHSAQSPLPMNAFGGTQLIRVLNMGQRSSAAASEKTEQRSERLWSVLFMSVCVALADVLGCALTLRVCFALRVKRIQSLPYFSRPLVNRELNVTSSCKNVGSDGAPWWISGVLRKGIRLMWNALIYEYLLRGLSMRS